jgi:phosphoethanolamine N-methyltransferase
MTDEQDHEYTEQFVAGIEWIWGEGFLSPGGPREVAAILEGIDLGGTEVLDIGCGLGAIDLLLVREHGAARVTGIDVEQPLIDRAKRAVAAAGLTGRIDVQLVEPGPLAFPDATFDVVFSKDSIIHISDKAALYAEVLRILRPGGLFVASDWLAGGGKPYSAPMRAWLDIVGISFDMETPENTAAALEAAGFVGVELRDRNDWYRRAVREELALVSGKNLERFAEIVGDQAARHRLASSTAKMKVVDRGELRPVHMRGRKPIR